MSPEVPQPPPEVEKREEEPRQIPPAVKEKEKTGEPKKFEIRRSPEAPLIERKIFVEKGTPVFPTIGALRNYQSAVERGTVRSVEDYGGKTINATAVLRLIDENRVYETARVAQSNGEEIGWLETGTQNAYEWSTNHVLRMKRMGEPPQLYASKEEAVAGTASGRFPDNLWDEDYVFPLLNADTDGIYLIGRPLPGTVKTDMKFPVWVRHDQRASQSLLVDTDTVKTAIQGLEYIKNEWTKLKDDPAARNDEALQRHFTAHYLSKLSLMSGNASTVPPRLKADVASLVNKTVLHIKQLGLEIDDVFNRSVEGISIMTDSQFANFLDTITAEIERLQVSLQKSPTYSVFDGRMTQKRIVVNAPQ